MFDEVLSKVSEFGISEVARRAGVSRSTLHRIIAGSAEPTISTMREIAVACGLDLVVATPPLSDPAAATAARVLLDEETPERGQPAEVIAWTARLRRQAGEDPVELVRAAGRSASPRHRTGAVFLRGRVGARRLASAGQAAGGSWALSGALGLSLAVPTGGPSVLWVDDVIRTQQMLADTFKPSSSEGADLIVAPTYDGLMLGAFEVEGVRYVAPIQQIIDGFGLSAETSAAAAAIAKEW